MAWLLEGLSEKRTSSSSIIFNCYSWLIICWYAGFEWSKLIEEGIDLGKIHLELDNLDPSFLWLLVSMAFTSLLVLFSYL